MLDGCSSVTSYVARSRGIFDSSSDMSSDLKQTARGAMGAAGSKASLRLFGSMFNRGLDPVSPSGRLACTKKKLCVSCITANTFFCLEQMLKTVSGLTLK